MLHIVLYEPEIPPNTGNIMRLCANTGARLHLIEPLAFSLDERRLRRAGLDYRDLADVRVHRDWQDFQAQAGEGRLWAFSRHAHHAHTEPAYRDGDFLLFGPETRGLPPELLEQLPPERRLRIPMLAERRSLNLANAAAIGLYEAWRQLGFPGADA